MGRGPGLRKLCNLREKFNLHRNLLRNRGLDAGVSASPFVLTVSDLTYTSL
jgi:hypothetical protein